MAMSAPNCLFASCVTASARSWTVSRFSLVSEKIGWPPSAARPRREPLIARLARLLVRADLRHLTNQSASPETICGKRQPQLGDHARETVQGARATRGCGRAFSRNQCPDQTQSPWDQYYKLWRAHIVVEKNQQFPKQHRRIAAGFAWSAEFLAYA